jgi:hypothetical protein
MKSADGSAGNEAEAKGRRRGEEGRGGGAATDGEKGESHPALARASTT